MKAESLNWKTAVWICSKCGKNFSKDQLKVTSSPPDEALRDFLRAGVKEAKGSTSDIRVMTAGCMKVCLKDQVTVVVTPENKAFTVHPENDKEELLRIIISGEF
jgi:predicted metal-binding protein